MAIPGDDRYSDSPEPLTAEEENRLEPAPRQTLSYLRQLFEEHGIRPKNKLGQNFLIDLNILDILERSAELGPGDVVLEVGTGTGSLTGRLTDSGARVLSVEVDSGFHQLAASILGPRPNLTLVQADVLKNKNQINPDIVEAIQRILATDGGRLKLVANLPYVVATPVIANLLIGDLAFERMVVTVQWEIAERLTAKVGEKAYGALAVLVQSLADVRILRRLPPSVFWPRPKVHSAIVRIVPRASKREKVGDPVRFRNFLRDLYSHRRKNLRAALSGLPSGRRSKAEVDARLEELGISGNVRAEDLGIEEHLRLCGVFQP